jgi:hypothetical protein
MEELIMGKRKMEMIENILELLRPNAYLPERSEWVDTQSGLLRMSVRELNAITVLLMAKRNKKT